MKLITIFAIAGSAAMAAEPFTNDVKGNQTMTKMNVVQAAEKMPEENYSFKPTDDIRSFGQLVGHVADASNMFCSAAKGESNPGQQAEKNLSSKADLVKAITAAMAYCDSVFEGMTDAKGSEMISLMGQRSRLGALAFNNMHNMEHYGNMVTYMRLKGLVPPSTERSMAGKKGKGKKQ